MSLDTIVLPSIAIIHYVLFSNCRIRSETSKLSQLLGLSHPLCDVIHESHA